MLPYYVVKTLKEFPEIVSDIELGIQFAVVLSQKQNIYEIIKRFV